MKNIINKFEEVILVSLLVSMSSILMLQIVARYLFQSSFSWSEELVRYLFIWSTFIGIPYCIKEGSSLKILQFTDLLPQKIQSKLFFINKFILIIFFSILATFGFIVTKGNYLSGQTSPALEIPMWIIYASVFVSSILSILRLIQKLYIDYRMKNSDHNY